jgi:hypothetical protein
MAFGKHYQSSSARNVDLNDHDFLNIAELFQDYLAATSQHTTEESLLPWAFGTKTLIRAESSLWNFSLLILPLVVHICMN